MPRDLSRLRRRWALPDRLHLPGLLPPAHGRHRPHPRPLRPLLRRGRPLPHPAPPHRGDRP
ncbi:hypothetical protein DLE60_27375 [Micromonospora globispora]|nr:hypothetical protein DLE60_27375 [Micromonospora globispora]